MMNQKQVVIIRHAEKPGNPSFDKDEDGPNLSTRGYERAAALAVYVTATFGNPDFLFATKKSKHSNRPVETIMPLARALNLKINSKHADDDFQEVATDILHNSKYTGKLVLICWHHGTIPSLTQALGGNPPQLAWPGGVFDRVWQIEYPDVSPIPPSNLTVKNLAQMLLYCDSSE